MKAQNGKCEERGEEGEEERKGKGKGGEGEGENRRDPRA